MSSTVLDEKYVENVFSSLSSALKSMGAPIPAVSRIAAEDNSPYRILTSTLISLRTRDSVTWEASERLFLAAPTFKELYPMSEESIASLIKPAGFYLRKANQLKRIAEIVEKEWNGVIPPDRDSLLSLPGVGIKTANLVMNLSFGVDEVCVDCHVHQIANRLGWIETSMAEESEKELKKILPKRFWIPINELFVMWGQNVCTPISPKCSMCPLESSCPKKGESKTR